MGVRILSSDEDGAVIYDSVSMTAFGPVFEDQDEADEFLTWLHVDARSLSDAALRDKVAEFRSREEDAA